MEYKKQIVKLTEERVKWWLPGGRDGGNKEMLVKGYKLSVLRWTKLWGSNMRNHSAYNL